MGIRGIDIGEVEQAPDEAQRRFDAWERAVERRTAEEMPVVQAWITQNFGPERYEPDLPINPDLLTLGQAARITGLSLSTLQTQRRRGRLHCTKAGRDWMVSTAELRHYLTSRRTRATELPAASIAPELPVPPRLPLWARVASEGEGYTADGLAIIKPGDDRYDDEYAFAVHESSAGRGIHYATPDEVEAWDRDNADTMGGEG